MSSVSFDDSGSQQDPSSFSPVGTRKEVPASFETSDISFDKEQKSIWDVPEPQFPRRLMRVHGEVINAIRKETDIGQLKQFLDTHIYLIFWGKLVRDELEKLVKKYAPPDAHFSDDMDPAILLQILADTLDGYQKKFALFDVSLEGSQLLEGTALQIKIEESKKKISELFESYQKRLNDAEANVWHLQGIIDDNMELIKSYEARISHLYQQVLILQVRKFDEPKPDQTNFFRELKQHLERDLHLNSTFKEELAAEKRTKHSLFQEICRLNELRIFDQQQQIEEIAQLAKDLELDEGIRKAIVEKIQTLTVKPREIHKAVNDWMKEIHSCIGPKEDQIQELKEGIKILEDQIARDTLQYQEASRQYNELLKLMMELDVEINEKMKTFELKQQKLEKLDQSIQVLEKKSKSESFSPSAYYDARSIAESMRRSPKSTSAFYHISPPSRSGTPDFSRIHHSTPKSGIYPPGFQDISSYDISPHSRSDTPYPFSYREESRKELREGSSYPGVAFYDNLLHSKSDTPDSARIRHSTPKFGIYPPKFKDFSSYDTSPHSRSDTSYPFSYRKEPQMTLRRRLSYPGGSFYDNLLHSKSDTPDFGKKYDSISKSSLYPPEFSDISSSISISYEESPENLRRGSPYRGVRYSSDSSPISIDSTPRSALTYSSTPPSPFHIHSPLMENYGEKGAMMRAFRTQPVPGPSRKFASYTAAVDPLTQSIRASNRFAVGKSFNMRSVCPTSTPYRQATRVASFIPESGGSGRMIDYPLNVKHSAELTPTQYVTPFISKSRFGYTDPAARILNIPPGDDLDVPTPFRKTTPSTIPKFVIPDTRQLQQREISPVMTYGLPPAVTPTTTRRHGLFTPRGIFRKKHFNVRRIYQPEEYQSPELPWSPQYLPKDSRSPIDQSLTSPPRFSDKSISWEESYQYPYDINIMNKTFEASPIRNKTFDATTSHAMSRTFDASSPRTIHVTYDTPPPFAVDRTFDASSPYAINRTFDAISPHAINRTFDTSSPYAVNRTFAASSPHAINRTFDTSSPYAVNRTFDASSPHAINRTFDTSSPYAGNRTFDESSRVMKESFYTSPDYAMNRTFNRSLSSPFRRTFQKSESPALDRTVDRSVTLARDRTFNGRQPSPTMNTTFNNIQSPTFNRTFDRSLSPLADATFDTSRSNTESYNSSYSI